MIGEMKKFIDGFRYKKDPSGKDTWYIPKKPEGDCEQFALGLLWILSEKKLDKFWFNLVFGKNKLHYVTTKNGVGHVVLQDGGQYIDNWTREFVSRREMEKLGHRFSGGLYRWYHVAIKFLITELRS